MRLWIAEQVAKPAPSLCSCMFAADLDAMTLGAGPEGKRPLLLIRCTHSLDRHGKVH